jgi:DNA-binding phage protein
MSVTVLKVEVVKRKITYDNRGRASLSWREYTAKPRLYLGADMGDDGKVSQMEHILYDRYSARDLTKFARDNGLLAEILNQAGLHPDTKTVFSQKAGCSCGCSPASIIQTDGYGKSYDIYATIGDAELVQKAASWREGTKYLMAIKACKAMIQNARKSGLKKVELKKLNTYYSPESYHQPLVQR